MNLSFAFFDWNVVSSFILKGFFFSIQLTLVAMIGGIALGTAIALMRLSGKKWLVLPAAVYVNTLRSIPLVMVILWVAQHLPYTAGKAPEIGKSLAGAGGHTIEPLIKPIGLNWKIGIGLITSLAARETIVGTLGQIYGMDPKSQGLDLQRALRNDLSPGGAFALLVFFAFAMQCISTIAVVRRETTRGRSADRSHRAAGRAEQCKETPPADLDW